MLRRVEVQVPGRAIALVLAVALVLAGCKSGSDGDKPQGTGPNTSSSGSGAAGSSASTVPEKPLTSAVGDVVGARVEVYGLKRSNDALRLDFSIHAGSESVDFLSAAQDPGLGRNTFTKTVSGVALIDGPRAKEYRVLLGPENGSCRCTSDLTFLADGSVRLFAEFPLPPPDVKALHVVVPHFTPMLGVAIEGSGSQTRSPQSLTPRPAVETRGAGEQGNVSLEVYDVQRADGMVVLRFGFRNLGTSTYLPNNRFHGPDDTGVGDDVSGVTLLDEAAQKRYLVLRDVTGYCLCSTRMGGGVRAGTTQVLWAGFPAPPATTRSVKVELPEFPPLTVPITGEGP